MTVFVQICFIVELTWHEEAVMQDRHKVRVCVSVVHLLADEIKNLGGTFGVYMYLEEKKYSNDPVNISCGLCYSRKIMYSNVREIIFFLLTDSKRFDKASSSSFRSISK